MLPLIKTNQSTEIKALTGIRGVAALYVAIFHFYFYYLKKVPDNFIHQSKYLHSFFYHGYIGVDLFFALSAFVITLSSKKYFDRKLTKENYIIFLQKRWVRIYPAYLIMLIYAYVFVNDFNRTTNFIVSLTLLNSLFGVTSIAVHFWSLSAEWVTYLIYPIYVKIVFFKKDNLWVSLLVLIGTSVLILACIIKRGSFLQPFELSINQGYPALLRCFGNYFLGMSMYSIYKKYPNSMIKKEGMSWLISIAILVLLFFSFTDILISIFFSLLILNIAYDSNRLSDFLGSKVIHLLGVISYPLYLIHVFITFELDNIKAAINIFYSGSNQYLVLFILFLIASLGLSYGFTYFIETPCIRFLSKRFRRNDSPIYMDGSIIGTSLTKE